MTIPGWSATGRPWSHQPILFALVPLLLLAVHVTKSAPCKSWLSALHHYFFFAALPWVRRARVAWARNDARRRQEPQSPASACEDLLDISIDHDPPLAPHQRPGGGELLIHYASPMITAANTVLVPVKTFANGNFEINAVGGTNGKSIWKMKTDYVLPPYDWVPPVPAQLTNQNRLLCGRQPQETVLFRDSPESRDRPNETADIPFTAWPIQEEQENLRQRRCDRYADYFGCKGRHLFFGFIVLHRNPAGLTEQDARVDASGKGTWISAQVAAGDPQITQVAMNCAPAISANGSTVYMAVSDGSTGYFVQLDAATLVQNAGSR